jgi:DNA-directed RNA polymerase specialized sigma24 family protein
MSQPDPALEAQLVGLHRSLYAELVQLAAVFVDDVGLCEEVVQDAFVKLPTLGVDGFAATAALRQLVLALARSASAESGAVATGLLGLLRRLDRDDADMVVLHHYLELPVDEAASSLGLGLRAARKALARGEKQLDRLATAVGGAA